MKIVLNIGIGDGDIKIKKFNTLTSAWRYLDTIDENNRVWLGTVDGENEGIIVSEHINDVFNHFTWHTSVTPKRLSYHIQEYESYESAFMVALAMKEHSSKCYDNIGINDTKL